MSPTARSLKMLRDDGWLCAVVERFNPHVKIRQDLFGFIDILAIKGTVTLGVQATSGSNVAARIAKINALPTAAQWKIDPVRKIEVHGWRKVGERGKRKTWECRIECL